MKINGREFNFDATTLDGIKAMEDALKNYQKEAKRSTDLIRQGKLYDAAVHSIESVKEFFIKLVGVDVVGDCNSPTLAAIFVEDFQKQCDAQRMKVKKDYFK